MRIAYISADPGIPVTGGKGASTHIRQLIRAFLEAGATVDLFTTNAGDGNRDFLGDGAFHLISDAVSGTEPAGPVDKRLAKELAWITQAERIEQAVIDRHGEAPYDFIYERQSLWSRAGVGAAAALAIPCIMEVNAPLRDEAQRYRKLAAVTQTEAIERDVYSSADAVVAVSDGVRRHVIAAGGRAATTHVMANGVDREAFSPSITPAHVEGLGTGPVIGFSGGLKHWHGIQELLEAFRIVSSQIADARLLIVGDGPKRSWIEGFMAGAALEDKVVITGWMAHEQIPALVRRMDIATAPYPAHENFYFSPLKLFEYMAAGRPVVASALGQIRDVIEHGRNGLLSRAGHPGSLAEEILNLCRDPHLAERLGRQAVESSADYSWRSIADRITAIAQASKSASPRRERIAS